MIDCDVGRQNDSRYDGDAGSMIDCDEVDRMVVGMMMHYCEN